MGLALDSRATAGLPGIRGTTELQPRQLLFESPHGNVHLRIEDGSGRKVQILGQFLPASGGTGKLVANAHLEQDGRTITRKLSPHGEFQFRAVTPSEVRIRIEWNDLVLTLGPLDLSAGSPR